MKYIFLNDISFVLNKMKKILSTYLFSILFVSFFYNMNKLDLVDMINVILGNNFKINSSLYIELIMYVLHLSICIYMVFSIYIKDVRYQLDNIFLRVTPNSWIRNKNISFLLIMFLFKIIEYLLLMILMYLFGYNLNITYITSMFVTDYLYYILIQYFSLIAYITFNLLDRAKIIILISIVIFCFLYPKNIMNCTSNINIVYIAICILLLLSALKYIFKYNSKKIIQKVGKI